MSRPERTRAQDQNVQVAGHQNLRLYIPECCSSHGDNPHAECCTVSEAYGLISSFLVKPVSRDAVIVQHLIDADGFGSTYSAETANSFSIEDSGDSEEQRVSLPSLGFVKPFTPLCLWALRSFCPTGSTVCPRESKTDALQILGNLRVSLRRRMREGVKRAAADDEALAGPKPLDVESPIHAPISFKEYFELCRAELIGAETFDDLGPVSPQREGDGHNTKTLKSLHLGSQLLSREVKNEDKKCDQKMHEGETKKHSKSTVSKPWEIYLANACGGMVAPCVVDLKMGKMRTTPNSERGEEKEDKDRGTTAKSCGVRLTGMHYYAAVDRELAEGESEVDAGSRTDFELISQFLPKSWERTSIPSIERLREVLEIFFTAHVFGRCGQAKNVQAFACREGSSFPEADARAGGGRGCNGAFCFDLHKDRIAEALFLTDKSGSPTFRSPNKDEDEDSSSVSSLSSPESLLKRRDTERSRRENTARQLRRRVPLRQVVRDVLTQISGISRVLSLPPVRTMLTNEFSFLSSSILIVFDMDAALRAEARGKGPIDESLGEDTTEAVGGGEGLGHASSRDGECRQAESSSARVLLIDFDRCGPRDEHYEEDVIQFIESIKGLESIVEEISSSVQ